MYTKEKENKSGYSYNTRFASIVRTGRAAISFNVTTSYNASTRIHCFIDRIRNPDPVAINF